MTVDLRFQGLLLGLEIIQGLELAAQPSQPGPVPLGAVASGAGEAVAVGGQYSDDPALEGQDMGLDR